MGVESIQAISKNTTSKNSTKRLTQQADDNDFYKKLPANGFITDYFHGPRA